MTDDRSALHPILNPEAVSDMPAIIFIVRHGATKMNNQTDMSEDRIRAWTDVPLVEAGRQEARRAALKLKAKGIKAIVSSDLVRAKETAEIIGKIIGVPVEISPKLRPWKLGTFTGVSTKEALPKIAIFVREKPDDPVPEGESFNEFKTRMFDGFADALAKHPEGLLIVTHHRDLQTAEAWDEAGQLADHSIDLDVFLQKGEPPGAIAELKTSLAALRGSPADAHSSTDDEGGNGMIRDDKPIGTGENPAMGPADRFKQKWAATGKMPVQVDDGVAPEVSPAPVAGSANTLAHGRAIAGAKALHAVGHISESQRDKHIAKSQKAIGQRKPFGAFAP